MGDRFQRKSSLDLRVRWICSKRKEVCLSFCNWEGSNGGRRDGDEEREKGHRNQKFYFKQVPFETLFTLHAWTLQWQVDIRGRGPGQRLDGDINVGDFKCVDGIKANGRPAIVRRRWKSPRMCPAAQEHFAVRQRRRTQQRPREAAGEAGQREARGGPDGKRRR